MENIPKNEAIEDTLREETPLYPKVAVRELVANALIHQDFQKHGTGPRIDVYAGRLEVANPGKPLMNLEEIKLPPQSRNEAVAALMRRMRICEERGSGLQRVAQNVELHQLPPPLFEASHDFTRVTLYGPRSFAKMSDEERVRACYYHAVLKNITGEKLTNRSLRNRLGIDDRNAAQATAVLKAAQEKGLIVLADPKHPKSGYKPFWA